MSRADDRAYAGGVVVELPAGACAPAQYRHGPLYPTASEIRVYNATTGRPLTTVVGIEFHGDLGPRGENQPVGAWLRVLADEDGNPYPEDAVPADFQQDRTVRLEVMVLGFRVRGDASGDANVPNWPPGGIRMCGCPQIAPGVIAHRAGDACEAQRLLRQRQERINRHRGEFREVPPLDGR